MSSTTVVRYFSDQVLTPRRLLEMSSRFQLNVAVPPGVAWKQGVLLTPPSGTATADVQTITVAATGGTYTIAGVNPLTGATFLTAAITYVAAGPGDVNVAAALNAVLGTGAVTVSALVVTFSNAFAYMPIPLMTIGTNSLTGGANTVTIAHTTTGQSGSSTAVQTIAFTGSPTGGTFVLSGVNPMSAAPWTTAAIAYASGATGDTNIAAGINAVIGGGATVTVSSLAVTFGGSAASSPVPLMTLTTNGLTGGSVPSLTVANTTFGSSAGVWTYYTGGTTSPTAMLKYAIVSDSVGDVSIGTVLVDEHGAFDYWAIVYIRGVFLASDLPNIDANAVTKMNGRIINSQSVSTAGALVYFP